MVIAIATYYHSKNIFKGMLFGEPFDSRLMLLIHEHWWQWFNGKTAFREMQFFYPFDKVLGLSDTFLVQGIIYSFFRLTGINMADSWSITTLISLILGFIGWLILGRLFIKNFGIRLIWVAATLVSLPFSTHFNSTPNFVGYTWISWILILLFKFPYNNKIKNNIAIVGIVVLLEILLLSAYYAAIFSIMILGIYSILHLVFVKKFKFNWLKLWQSVDWRIWFISSPIIIWLAGLFVYIYVPVAKEPYRPIEEMLSNSYTLFSFFGGSSKTGFFEFIYSFLIIEEGVSQKIGIGIFAMITLFLIYPLYSLVAEQNINKKIFLIYISSIIVSIYFLKINGFSIHAYFYGIIPGADSIRSPNRYLAVMSFILIFTFFFFCDKLLSTTKNKKSISLIYVFSIILLIDQLRILPNKSWDESLLYDSKFANQSKDLKLNCDYFIYDAPGGWWSDQLKAMVFAYQYDVPTVNGYSGGFPSTYPTQEWLHEGDISGITEWIKSIPKTQRGCFTTGDLPIYYLNSAQNRFDFEDGFTGIETNGKDKWIWATRESNFALIYSGVKQKIKVTFDLTVPKCLESKNIQITKLPSSIIIENTLMKGPKKIDLEITMQEHELAKIEFRTDSNYCLFENDPRQLHFEIKNWSVTTNF